MAVLCHMKKGHILVGGLISGHSYSNGYFYSNNHLLAYVMKQTCTSAYSETGMQTHTLTPLTVGLAVLALANIPATRQRLLCLSGPASCTMCVSE